MDEEEEITLEKPKFINNTVMVPNIPMVSGSSRKSWSVTQTPTLDAKSKSNCSVTIPILSLHPSQSSEDIDTNTNCIDIPVGLSKLKTSWSIQMSTYNPSPNAIPSVEYTDQTMFHFGATDDSKDSTSDSQSKSSDSIEEVSYTESELDHLNAEHELQVIVESVSLSIAHCL